MIYSPRQPAAPCAHPLLPVTSVHDVLQLFRRTEDSDTSVFVEFLRTDHESTPAALESVHWKIFSFAYSLSLPAAGSPTLYELCIDRKADTGVRAGRRLVVTTQ